MAHRKPVRIDDHVVFTPPAAKIIDVVPEDVQSVTTQSGALISRADFARTPVPDGFETNLSVINKGSPCPRVS